MKSGLFSSAAEAGPQDILKMYTPQGSLVNISNRLESNLPDAPYRLELVAAHYNNGTTLPYVKPRHKFLSHRHELTLIIGDWLLVRHTHAHLHIEFHSQQTDESEHDFILNWTP